MAPKILISKNFAYSKEDYKKLLQIVTYLAQQCSTSIIFFYLTSLIFVHINKVLTYVSNKTYIHANLAILATR